jgi:hypothetical protein
MPKYVIFLIIANRPPASETKDIAELTKDPVFQKTLNEFLSWVKTEIEAERIKGGDFLLEASDETNIRIDFQNRDTPPEAELEKKDGESVPPPPKSLTTRGHQVDMSANIIGYYTAEFPCLNDVITWGRSCPIYYDGFALEIRQLKDVIMSLNEAPVETKEWVGDHIVSVRERLLEEGKMRKEEDGTQWVKLEDEEGIKELVVEAEERKAQTKQD